MAHIWLQTKFAQFAATKWIVNNWWCIYESLVYQQLAHSARCVAFHLRVYVNEKNFNSVTHISITVLHTLHSFILSVSFLPLALRFDYV